MRDYIFRGIHAWNDYPQEDWIYGSLIHVGSYCCILSPDDENDMDFPYLDDDLGTIDGKATPVIPETVGQFTGMLDKNGNRIFEGDIVRAMMDFGPAGMLENIVDIGFKKTEGYRWNYFDLSTIEVIGNVYENFFLLQSEN